VRNRHTRWIIRDNSVFPWRLYVSHPVTSSLTDMLKCARWRCRQPPPFHCSLALITTRNQHMTTDHTPIRNGVGEIVAEHPIVDFGLRNLERWFSIRNPQSSFRSNYSDRSNMFRNSHDASPFPMEGATPTQSLPRKGRVRSPFPPLGKRWIEGWLGWGLEGGIIVRHLLSHTSTPIPAFPRQGGRRKAVAPEQLHSAFHSG